MEVDFVGTLSYATFRPSDPIDVNAVQNDSDVTRLE